MRGWAVLGCMFVAACAGEVVDLDAGPKDAGSRDGGSRDAGVHDGGVTDAGPRDAGARDGGGLGPLRVQILGFNDFHGALDPPGATGGAAFLAAHIDLMRAIRPHTFTVVAGDLIGGTPLISALFHDEPTIEVMNAIGVDFVGVGNHEFDEGTAELERMQNGGCHPVDGCFLGTNFDGASFSFLAANVFRSGTADTLFPGYEVVDVEGVPIAFIGMTLRDTPATTIASGIADLTFFHEGVAANTIVAQLRAKGVETFVVMVHQGSPSGDCTNLGALGDVVAGLVPQVDVVLGGHTHTTLDCEVGGRIVTSAGANGNLLTQIELEIDRDTKDVVSATANNIAVTQNVTPNAAVTDIIERYRAAVDPLANRVVGTITGDLTQIPNVAGETTMGRVIADAQLAATSSAGAVIAFQQRGGVRSDLLFQRAGTETNDGQVTFAEVFSVHPFGNYLVTMTLTGAQIVQALESQFSATGDEPLHSSGTLTYVWDAAMPIGSRVNPTETLINGVPIDLAGTYRVTVNSFLEQSGRFTVFAAGTDVVGGVVDIDALAAYLTARSPLEPPTLGQVVRRN